ncbi:MAG: hypothetical protein RIF41_11805 [Polyangiaceae bacterium]
MGRATSFSVGLLTVCLGWAGCAKSQTTFEDDGGTEGTTSGTGGAGVGGMVNTGGDGAGGETLCDVDCSTIATPDCSVAVCNDGSHMGTVGSCVVINAEDGTSCEDGLFCTVNDACVEGVCTGGPQNDCGMAPDACEEILCDEPSQTCSSGTLPNGTPCDNTDDLCLVNEMCQNGLCVGDTKDCFFAPVPNECFNAVCNPVNGMCEPEPGNDGAACIDTNDLCSVGNTCAAGVCSGGSPLNCDNLTQGCDLGVCDPASGQCTTMTVMNGQMCDDLNGCTVGELCTNGTCGGGTPVTACSGAQTADGCCPPSCSVADDLDCAICVSDFDDGTLQGWTVSSTCSPQINWQPDTMQQQAGTHSLYYGDPAVHNFNCTGGAHQGTATSKTINLQPGNPNVTFHVFIDTEGGTFYDQLGLWVMPQNVQIWDRGDFPEGANGDTLGAFIQQTVDLSMFANQSIQLQFRFDTVDGVANSEEGVYVDSITVQGNCP